MSLTRKLLFLIFLITSTLYAQQDQGIWVVRDALTSSKDISKIINNAVSLKSNKIFLQFRALGTVYYPSALDIPTADVDSELLNRLFKEARKNNIEIHAWLNVCYIWSKDRFPDYPNHIINKSIKSLVEPIESKRSSEGYFLHPNDKANLSEIKSIIKELARLYDIKGIHLDYFRYPKEELHTSKFGRTQYALEYSVDPLNALQYPDRYIEERNFASYMYLQTSYRNFLINELTDALASIRNYMQKELPKLKLSVAVKPNPIAAKHRFLQDWASWLENNLCDFVVLMNYNPELNNFVNNLDLTKKNVDIKKIMVGIATYNIPESEVTKRVAMVKNSDYQGYVLFSYNYIYRQKQLFNHLRLKLN